MTESPACGIVESMLNLAHVRLRTRFVLAIGLIMMSVAVVTTFAVRGGSSSDQVRSTRAAEFRKMLLVQQVLSDVDDEYAQVGRLVMAKPAADAPVAKAEVASLRAACKQRTDELRSLATTATERRLIGEVEQALAEAHDLNDRAMALAAVKNEDAHDLLETEGEQRQQIIRQAAGMLAAWRETRIRYARAAAQASKTTALSVVLGGGISVLTLSMLVGVSLARCSG